MRALIEPAELNDHTHLNPHTDGSANMPNASTDTAWPTERRARSGTRLKSSLAFALCCAMGLTWAQSPLLDLPRVRLQAGLFRIDAQVAATDAHHRIGLMHRAQMPEHEGMLFVFERAAVRCFWMKDTLMPLSIAFIDENGRVVNTAEMEAGSTNRHCAEAPVAHVLEMNAGWFAKRRIDKGFVLKGPHWPAQ